MTGQWSVGSLSVRVATVVAIVVAVVQVVVAARSVVELVLEQARERSGALEHVGALFKDVEDFGKHGAIVHAPCRVGQFEGLCKIGRSKGSSS